jgi:hypothetical protein
MRTPVTTRTALALLAEFLLEVVQHAVQVLGALLR